MADLAEAGGQPSAFAHAVVIDDNAARRMVLRGAHQAVMLGDLLVISDRTCHCCHILRCESWSTIGGPGSQPGRFHHPCGLAVHTSFPKHLYVCDYGNARIQSFVVEQNEQPPTAASEIIGEAQLRAPCAAAICASTGELLVADQTLCAVLAFGLESSGSATCRQLVRSGLQRCVGLAVDEGARLPELFVCDCERHCIEVYDVPSGEHRRTLDGAEAGGLAWHGKKRRGEERRLQSPFGCALLVYGAELVASTSACSAAAASAPEIGGLLPEASPRAAPPERLLAVSELDSRCVKFLDVRSGLVRHVQQLEDTPPPSAPLPRPPLDPLLLIAAAAGAAGDAQRRRQQQQQHHHQQQQHMGHIGKLLLLSALGPRRLLVCSRHRAKDFNCVHALEMPSELPTLEPEEEEQPVAATSPPPTLPPPTSPPSASPPPSTEPPSASTPAAPTAVVTKEDVHPLSPPSGLPFPSPPPPEFLLPPSLGVPAPSQPAAAAPPTPPPPPPSLPRCAASDAPPRAAHAPAWPLAPEPPRDQRVGADELVRQRVTRAAEHNHAEARGAEGRAAQSRPPPSPAPVQCDVCHLSAEKHVCGVRWADGRMGKLEGEVLCLPCHRRLLDDIAECAPRAPHRPCTPRTHRAPTAHPHSARISF